MRESGVMESLFSWEVTSVFVPLLVAVAFGVLSLNDFKIAKTCFFCAAAYAVGGIFMWALKSNWTCSDRIISSGSALFLTGFLMAAAIRYVDTKKLAKKQDALASPDEFVAKIIEKLNQGGGAAPSKHVEETQIVNPNDGFVQFESRAIAIEREDDLKRIARGGTYGPEK